MQWTDEQARAIEARGTNLLLSAAAVFVYQGAIALLAGVIAPLLTEQIIGAMSAVGGLLIIALGINMLEVTKIRIGNLLPAMFLPILYYPIADWIGGLL